MNDRTLHLPLSFELTDGVRLLAARLGEMWGELQGSFEVARGRVPIQVRDLALLYCVRLWDDWGRNGEGWRECLGNGKEQMADGKGEAETEVTPYAFADRTSGEPVEGIDLRREPLVGLIEDACGWDSRERGLLVQTFLAARILRVEHRLIEAGEVPVAASEVASRPGLVLEDFALVNPHLLPGYRSIQKKGGEARAQQVKLEGQMKSAGHAAKLADAAAAREGLLLFEEPAVAQADREAALKILYGIDLACGRAVVASQYADSKALTQAALAISRSATPLEIKQVMAYLLDHAHNPAVSKDPAVILRDWRTYLQFAKPA